MARINGESGCIVIDDVLTMTPEDLAEAFNVDGIEGGDPSERQLHRAAELAANFMDCNEVENVINDAVYDIVNDAVARAIETVREEGE